MKELKAQTVQISVLLTWSNAQKTRCFKVDTGNAHYSYSQNTKSVQCNIHKKNNNVNKYKSTCDQSVIIMEDIVEHTGNEFWAKFIVIALHMMCNNTSCNATSFDSYHSHTYGIYRHSHCKKVWSYWKAKHREHCNQQMPVMLL